MFKQIQSGLSKFFTKERILILSVFILLSWVLISYSGSKGMSRETLQEYSNFPGAGASPSSSSNIMPQQQQEVTPPKKARLQPTIQPSVSSGSAPVSSTVTSNSSSPFLQQTASPSDLLPKDQNSQWSALNPTAMNQGNITMPDLLQAGYHIGLDTIGQTLRNPNLQLRSDPIIPKQDIGPWNLSTIEADIGRIPLEIGYSPSH